nr:nucleotidyl transferase AbiEii/AbiGii toxin family protein [Geobacter hydrogenophilus]
MNRKKVRYLLAGGLAVNLYGIERSTGDIDLVVELEQHNLDKFVEVMQELGFKPKVPVPVEEFVRQEKRQEWMRDKGMQVFSFFDPKNPFILLDVFIEMPFDFSKVYDNRVKIRAGTTFVPLVPVSTLIEMKEKAGRPKDLADVYYLKQIEKEWENE